MEILSMNCYKCGKGRKEIIVSRYNYTSCGLDNVFLKSVKKYVCENCGENTYEYEKLLLTHLLIFAALLHKPTVLNSEEVVYLRKFSRYSWEDLSLLTGINILKLKFFENGNCKISIDDDRSIRVAMLSVFLGYRDEKIFVVMNDFMNNLFSLQLSGEQKHFSIEIDTANQSYSFVEAPSTQ